MNFTFYERLIADLFGKFPLLKKIIKKNYLKINYFLFRSKKQSELEYNDFILKLKEYYDKNSHIFIGYYDLNPINSKGQIIYHKTKNLKDNYFENDTIDIMLDDEKISETNSWNYQIGSRLMWIDDDRIIHNFYSNGYKSKIINIRTGKEEIFDFPIYAANDKFLITNDFDRLAILSPEYGYFNNFSSKKFNKIEKLKKDSEIYIFYLEKGVFEKLFSIKDLLCFLNTIYKKQNENFLILENETLKIELNRKANVEIQEKKDNQKMYISILQYPYCYINHIQFLKNSENGFYFHFRCIEKLNGRVFSFLILFDLQNKTFKLLADGEIVSHFNNFDDNSIFGWMKYENSSGYYRININTLKKEKIEIVDLNQDGHPTIKNGILLTDTYPDRSGMQNIIIFDIENKKLISKFSFLSPIEYRFENRCDLHPRLVFANGKQIKFVIDSTHKGNRGVYIGYVNYIY